MKNDWIHITDDFALSLPMIVIIVLWSIVWKGLALWHAARRDDAGWFVAMLVINTIGLLEIAYLFGVLKMNRQDLFSMRTPGRDAAHQG